MPNFEDANDGTYAGLRAPAKFQVSRRFSKEDPSEPDRRYAYQVFDSNDEVIFESEDGWETILRETSTRQQLKAVFFEHGPPRVKPRDPALQRKRQAARQHAHGDPQR